MSKVCIKLQVCFEDPFWIGIFEKMEDTSLYVCKVTFGPEPKDYEVAQFIKLNYDKLKFSQPVDYISRVAECKNPKRMQREVRRQIQNAGTSTKSQLALAQLLEQSKLERKDRRKRNKEAEEKKQFEARQQKKKEKHRGR